MKKRLESELISIAHRILKLKNKSEVDQLYLETRKLYETLAVLKFYGDNYEQVKSEVSQEELEEKLAVSEEIIQEEVKEIPAEEVVVAAQEIEEVIESEEEDEVADEEIIEEEEEIEEETEETDEEDYEEEESEEDDFENAINFEPIFELEDAFEGAEEEVEEKVEEKEEEVFEPESKTVEANKIESRQISFEDLLGDSFNEPVFVKPNDVVIPPSLKEVIEEKPLSLNDQHSKAINIGMNDRIAFVKHLFDDSAEDYNRVLSQLNSFTTKEEAVDFIEEIIKPDYENWVGSEEYAERFMEIVKNKFN